MSIRAVHIEVIESMDTSSFINALRRFLAIRGPVIQLRSDCGTNFVGACNELQAVLKPSDASPVKRYLLKEGCEWLFNPPHASHTGGAWERMIGVAKRVLEAMLASSTQPMFSGRDGGESTFQCCNRVESGKTRPATCRRAT